MPIHLIWGDDFGCIDRSIEKFIKNKVDSNWSSINLSRLDGQNPTQSHQALEEVRTPPFCCGERIVLLKRSPFCNGCSPELAKHFESVVNVIPENSHLILNNQNKPDNRLKTTKLINNLIKTKQATEKNFSLPAIWDEQGQKKYIQRIADQMNILLNDDTIFALLEVLGNDIQRVSIELQKLVLLEEAKLKGNRNERILIHKKTVNELIHGISSNTFQIGDCLLSNNWGHAIRRIDSLLNQGEPALKIIASLTTQVRGWLWVSLLEKEKQKDVSFIAKQAGIANPKRVYVIRKQIQGKTPIFFIELLNKILEIEALLKKGVHPKNAFRDGLLIKC